MGVGMAEGDSRTTARLLRAKRPSMPIIALLLLLIGLPSMFTWMLAAVVVITCSLWTMREKLVGIFIPAIAHLASAGMVWLLAPSGDSMCVKVADIGNWSVCSANSWWVFVGLAMNLGTRVAVVGYLYSRAKASPARSSVALDA